VRGTIPVLIGGGGEKVMLRLVAQWASTWHAFGAPDVIAHKSRVLDEHCEAIGRDPAEIERSVMVTHEDIATGLLDRYHEIGARHIVAIAREPDFDLADLRRLLAWRDSLG
jgi:alkanesulfonate monooxygenase SsuD/methylene tetrahydromethanopterin reductase-like flavin-dependent oxidoreductase (luciferase family)